MLVTSHCPVIVSSSAAYVLLPRISNAAAVTRNSIGVPDSHAVPVVPSCPRTTVNTSPLRAIHLRFSHAISVPLLFVSAIVRKKKSNPVTTGNRSPSPAVSVSVVALFVRGPLNADLALLLNNKFATTQSPQQEQ